MRCRAAAVALLLLLTGCAAALPDAEKDPTGFVAAVCAAGWNGGMKIEDVTEREDVPVVFREAGTFYEAVGFGSVDGSEERMTCLMSLSDSGDIISSPAYGWQE